jgi:acyl carrier protein
MKPDVESVVLATVRELARRVQPSRTDIAAHHTLTGDLGFVSLDVAELVAILEGELGIDPFALGATIADIRTVGDLVRAYSDTMRTP